MIERLEASLTRQTADNMRLRRVEAAAKAALTDLDCLIGDPRPLHHEQRHIERRG